MDVEKLIELVKGYIFLYDLGHQQYKNINLKSVTWEAIGRELNESGEVVRSKWKTVRDGYTKYKKQLKSSKGSDKKNVNYMWAPQLAFLDNFNLVRSSTSNASLDAAQPSPCAAADLENSPDITQSNPSTSSQVPPSQTPEPSRAYSNKRSAETRRNDDDVGRVLEFLNSKKKKKYDVIDHLFLSYADTFKKFPQREQAIVKLELAKLFTSTELQLLNNDTKFQYSITSPTYSTATSDEDRKVYS